jgi:two-component system sensor histidine kinase ChvG
MKTERRVRTLRNSVFLAMIVVVASPLLLALLSNIAESLFSARTAARTETSAQEIAAIWRGAETLDDPGRRARSDEVARRRDQRVRLLREETAIDIADHVVGRSWLFRVGDLFYGPRRAEGLEEHERRHGQAARRAVVAQALAQGTAASCAEQSLGNLLICESAVRVDADGGPVVVHVQGSSRRGVQALWEVRRQLVQLTMAALVVALGLAFWLSRRVVRPVEALREQALEGARRASPRADLRVARLDEVGQLAAGFNSLLAALEARRRENVAFLADLAHEFKNPVAAVRAAADQLDRGAALDAERQARLGAVIGRSARELDALVTQFLELARVEAGVGEAPRERVDLGALLRGLKEGVEGEGRYPGVTVELELEGGADSQLAVDGVPGQLESAFRNLVDNAMSFAGEPGRVSVRGERAGPEVRVRITDSGPGIGGEDLPRVFDRFYTTRRQHGGTGLGLALTRAIVEAHGGSVRAESAAAGGACLEVALPAAG